MRQWDRPPAAEDESLLQCTHAGRFGRSDQRNMLLSERVRRPEAEEWLRMEN